MSDVPYNGDIDLHFSPDDGGWYATNYRTGAVSEKVYEDRDQLIADLNAGRHPWEEEA